MATVNRHPKTAGSAPVLTRVLETAERMGEPPWETILMVDERNAYSLLGDRPGDTNRPHYHDDFDEVWYVVRGKFEWEISTREESGVKRVETYHAEAGDIIFCPKGMIHFIRTVGTENSLRLGVGPPTERIIWVDEDLAPSL